jgi:hypothetical protein
MLLGHDFAFIPWFAAGALATLRNTIRFAISIIKAIKLCLMTVRDFVSLDNLFPVFLHAVNLDRFFMSSLN